MTNQQADISHYTYRISWSPADGDYVATCAEFPSLSWLSPSQVEALTGLQLLIRDAVSDMVESGEPVPVPFAERVYSGKFNLRVGSELHRTMSIAAAEDGLSLNQYILRRLSSA
ncbi:type II toxin-antitoxin system HicB family antitoxin [Corynebacterium sp.]|uniref:type II toxin-antitoxin system HicB family antitoxin n=1 Tax=Corynebacterium sp. TaxID=1720 RepID=UPI0026DF949B|nr:type II toxin-antitoxin system HicB family antitoxin [Corynebacterium sp.]MDO5513025.1 toxin-antitoxin system HicB family antitoxin [Corynebacterium sp.]